MGYIRSYKNLIAWRKAMDLIEVTYRLTSRFPANERFGLVAQLRRAAVSIVANIAEGYGRRTRADYVHFLDIAAGSANEVEAQIPVARRLGSIDETGARPALSLISEVHRLLRGLVKKLEASPKSRVSNQRLTS